MRMDSFPRFTRSVMFKELLVQDLDGKQLPVLDVTPAPHSEPTTAAVQENNDPVKAKAVTRTNSTKVSHTL